jgi:hypothetical protein
MLGGSKLVFEDGSGATIDTLPLGDSWCVIEGLHSGLGLPENGALIYTTYWIRLWKQDVFRVRFEPGAAYGDRAAPSEAQDVSYRALDAAGFRMDYDTGTDGATASTAGSGVVIGPRLCVGFPAPGCDP